MRVKQFPHGCNCCPFLSGNSVVVVVVVVVIALFVTTPIVCGV